MKEKMKQYTALVEQELKKYLRSKDSEEGILNEAVEYSVMSGGKRIRSSLMLASGELFHAQLEEVVSFAVAMEMVHNFSLIHDDLPAIDNDDLRRGRPTTHKQFGEGTAILAGDSLLNQAYLILAEDILKAQGNLCKRKLMALQEFAKATDRMILGEYVDTALEGKEILQEQLEYIHENKTGALIIASCKIGALIAGTEAENIEKMEQYAKRIGLAFQIRDDILSEIADEKIFGKPVGNDKKRGKCTYVTKYGLEEAKAILHCITKEAVEIIESFGAEGKILKELAIYIEEREK